MKRPSRGMTLVEVTLAMMIATALVGLLAAAISQVIVFSSSAGEHLQAVAALGHLGEQFRRDVHAARSAQIEAPPGRPERLRLDMRADRPIEYTITAAGLERLAASADRPPHRELYALPGMKLLGFKTQADRRELSLVVGRMAHPTAADSPLAGEFSITATLATEDHLPAATEPRN